MVENFVAVFALGISCRTEAATLTQFSGVGIDIYHFEYFDSTVRHKKDIVEDLFIQALSLSYLLSSVKFTVRSPFNLIMV